jgi:hypothetical protein
MEDPTDAWPHYLVHDSDGGETNRLRWPSAVRELLVRLL